MKRRVVMQAKNCLTVTLPVEWTRKNKVVKSTELEVIQRGNSLVMQAPKNNVEDVIIRTSGDLVSLKSQLISFYLSGLDRITVLYNEKISGTVIRTIREEVSKHLHCMEIDEIQENKCIIKSFSNPLPQNFNKVIRNSLNLVLINSKKCTEVLRTNNQDLVNEIVENHSIVKKFCFYALRLMYKNADADINKIIASTRATDKISEISNHLRHISKHHSQKKRSKQVIEAMEKLQELLLLAHNSYYNIEKVDDFFKCHSEMGEYVGVHKEIIDKELKENIGMVRDLAMNLVRQALIINYKKEEISESVDGGRCVA